MAELEDVERAMVAIRRRQSRRTLAARAAGNTALVEVLDALEEAPLGVSEVARVLRVAQPRASKLVAEAVEAGLVRREADQADGRRAPLVLTDAGRALLARVHAQRRGAFAEAMDGWSAEDRATFARLLTRFVDGLA
jgi:DNA-binding MarR family transcriptional regulator